MKVKRILVVEDEPIVGYSIKISLQPEGYVIDVVTSAAEALSRYESGKYDLILTDNLMPGMTGAGLADRIKRSDPSQPIILLTGSPPFEPVPVFDRIVMKPFAVVDLRKAVAEVIQFADLGQRKDDKAGDGEAS